MKKVIIVLVLMLFSFASAKDYSSFCSSNSPSRSFGGFLMSSTGLNSLTRNIIESQIASAIKKETGNKIKIKMNNFYSNNILSGEFKSMKATAKSYKDEMVSLADIKVETICEYNKIEYKEDSISFPQGMVLKYSAKMTQDDLNKTISSLLKIPKISIKIREDKIFFKYILKPLVNKMNLISWKVPIDKTNSAKMDIDKVEIINGEIHFAGYILINKSKY